MSTFAPRHGTHHEGRMEMGARTSGRLRRGLALLATTSLLAIATGGSPGIALAAGPSSGVLCTSAAGTSPTFTLTARSGYISMPDGNTVFAWSYANGSGAFQFPGPVLCVNQGDTVTVVLNNTLGEAVSIMFPGIDGVLANGAPAQPEASGPTITSLVPSAQPGGSVTYSFTAARPGTFLYESGTDPGKQVQMGLYGALIVRPTGHADAGYTDGAGNPIGQFNPGNEYVMLLSEIDPLLHQAVEFGDAYDVTQLHPRYWLINGRAFPDTIAPNNAAWLPSQPYSSLVHVPVTDTTQPGGSHPPALVRYLDAGSRNHPFHPHGQNGTVIARDALPLVDAANNDLSYETYSFSIGSGQTWDQTYHYDNQEAYDPGTNPVPVTIPQLQNLNFKGAATYYGGSPYLGYKAGLPVGTTTFNQCGEFYMVWHSHALNEVANYDASFGGMLTLERIDPLPSMQHAGTCSQ